MTPLLTFDDSSSVSFWTRAPDETQWADRLEVRLCTGTPCTSVGALATDVGGFTTTLMTVNEAQNPTGYPQVWTQFILTNTEGLPTSGQGRVAFRYHVTDAGPDGLNSNFIGIDTVEIEAAAIGAAIDGNDHGLDRVSNPATMSDR